MNADAEAKQEIGEDVAGEQVNASTRRYAIAVPANGTRVVRVTYETRY